MDFKAMYVNGVKKIEIELKAVQGFIRVPDGANCIYVRNGKMSFGFSSSIDGDKKTKNGRLFKIPSGAFAVGFHYYCLRSGGHDYGSPQWLRIPIQERF